MGERGNMKKLISGQSGYRFVLYLLVNLVVITSIALYIQQFLTEDAIIKSWYIIGIAVAIGVVAEVIQIIKGKGVLLLLLLLLSSFLILLWGNFLENMLELISQTCKFWFLGRISDEINLIGCLLVTEVFASFIIVVLTHYLVRSFWIRQITAVGNALWLVALLNLTQEEAFQNIAESNILRMGIIAAMLYILLILLEWIQKEDIARITVYLLPFLLTFLFLFSIIPTRSEPYSWGFVTRLHNNTKELIFSISTGIGNWTGLKKDDFSMSFTGLSEKPKIGGGVQQEDKAVMKVESSSHLITNMYLIGGVYDTFENRIWSNSGKDDRTECDLDYQETVYAAWRYDKENIEGYLRPAYLHIFYDHFNTKYLFYPAKSSLVKSVGDDKISVLGDMVLFKDYAEADAEYTVRYMQMNLDEPHFYEFLKQERNYVYDPKAKLSDEAATEINKLLDKYHPIMNATEKRFYENTQKIYDIYLQEPDISERVKAYIDRLTAGCTDDIDKLKMIEALLQQYTYTMTPEEIPKDEDFLEYFLLESKEGYCTYFATAFVLLARYEGFPARYVQGFCVSTPKSADVKNISVSSMDAHAWAEVYIKGVGWIPFEATPSYGELRYQSWKWDSEVEKNAQNIQMVQGEHYEELEIPENTLKDWDLSNLEIQEKDEIAPFEFLKIVKYIVAFAILLLGVEGLFLICSAKWSKYKYKQLAMEEKILYDLGRIMVALKAIGYDLADGETLMELGFRINSEQEEPLISQECIAIIEQVRYGQKRATIEQQQCVEQQKWELVNFQKERSWIKSLILRWKMYF